MSPLPSPVPSAPSSPAAQEMPRLVPRSLSLPSQACATADPLTSVPGLVSRRPGQTGGVLSCSGARGRAHCAGSVQGFVLKLVATHPTLPTENRGAGELSRKRPGCAGSQHLQLQFRGMWRPLPASGGTAHVERTNIHAGRTAHGEVRKAKRRFRRRHSVRVCQDGREGRTGERGLRAWVRPRPALARRAGV